MSESRGDARKNVVLACSPPYFCEHELITLLYVCTPTGLTTFKISFQKEQRTRGICTANTLTTHHLLTTSVTTMRPSAPPNAVKKTPNLAMARRL